MNFITRLLRTILAADTLLGMILIPFHVLMVIGCLIAGKFAAAITFAVTGLFGVVLYTRYWRRYPLGRFPQN